jgi:hypothetical protein
MKVEQTNRGFDIAEFKDKYGEQCSLQKSSLATEDCIWLGISKPKLTVFENSNRGKYLVADMPDNMSVNARMHLTRDMVKELLPYLTKFVETGDID